MRPISDLADRALVEAFLLTRDEWVFQLIYHRHADALWRLALYCAEGNRTDAEDTLNLSGEFTVNDEAFTVAAGDSLNSLVVAINSRTYGANRGVTASVVDNRLVLTAQSMGIANSLALAETTGSPLQALGLFSAASTINASNELAALNASFSVNGVGITRSQNTGLTDVVEGVTLALANDAAGKSAAFTVSDDTATARAAIDAFITKFNDNQTYLEVKAALTASTENGKTTYTRGENRYSSLVKNL